MILRRPRSTLFPSPTLSRPRRQSLSMPGAGVLIAPSRPAWPLSPVVTVDDMLRARWAEIHRGTGGRLGTCLLDSGPGWRIGQRENERFPMCSTFKFILAAAVLQRVDKGELRLMQQI
ncbi:serine hydrolase, partial [Xanthomonas campestris]|uniref:serine hydrolase n=1 Tax=Xanthomonas campestris TaxID=339 RepID=UPI0040396EA1